MDAEYTYFALFVLVTTLLVMTIWRMFRAARTTIKQLNYETRRDKRQHARIEREKHFQAWALRRGTHKINGKRRKVQWDKSDRRAKRDYHVDEAADEVFDPVSDYRGMDVRTPWGWPAPKGQPKAVSRTRRASASRGNGGTFSGLFKTKQVIDETYLAQRQWSLRHLVEDRYGRVGYAASQMPEIEWSTPELPAELIEEREKDQIHAWKPVQETDLQEFRGIRLVADNTEPTDTHKKASGA